MKTLVAAIALLLFAVPALALGKRPVQIVYRDTCMTAQHATHHHSRRAQSKRSVIGGRSAETARREAVREEVMPNARNVGRLESAQPERRDVVTGDAHPVNAYESTRSGIWGAVRDGFGLTAGWRWDREQVCPSQFATVLAPPTGGGHHRGDEDHDRQCDPFFVGAELRLPIASKVTAFGNFDRDWTEAAHWDARVGLSVGPWAKR